MLLRMMREGDAEGIVKMAVENTEPPVPEGIFRNILAEAQTFVLEDDGKLLGFCNYKVMQDGLHLIFMAVERRAQSKGYGRILMEQADRMAVKSGKAYLRLEVKKANKQAINFYRKNGFAVIMEEPEKLRMAKRAGATSVQPAGKNGGESKQSTLNK